MNDRCKESVTKAIDTSALAISTVHMSDKILEEIRFHATGATGFAAEQANNLWDNLTFTPARIIGDNNAKNGPDRQVWFTPIQTKYYSTAKATVNAAFEDGGQGVYRYFINQGRVMNIEVPKDQYDDAVNILKEKILAGQIKGITNPEQAEDIVRAGHCTYTQAKNIAKAGNIDSLIFDTVNGVVIGASVFGISSVINYAVLIWNGVNTKDAVKQALYSGTRAGGAALASTVITGQITKACSTKFINTVRVGTISVVVILFVLSANDIRKIFNRSITKAQAARNLVCNAAGVIAGKKGYELGAMLGTAVCPGIGTKIGGIICSYLFGSIARIAAHTILDEFYGNPENSIRKLFEEEMIRVAGKYLLTRKEAEILGRRVFSILNEEKLKKIKNLDDPKKYVSRIMNKFTMDVIRKRNYVVSA